MGVDDGIGNVVFNNEGGRDGEMERAIHVRDTKRKKEESKDGIELCVCVYVCVSVSSAVEAHLPAC